ncbi:methyltransferase protein [Tulasnella sp. UAMH 9824]|nr:methyltransferase protein [Tulasnella sp. UAMH 9824]
MSRTPIYLHLSDPPTSGDAEASFNPSVRRRSALENQIEEALQDSYNGVCLSITNDEWRRRWTSLCLTTPSPAEGGTVPMPISDELKEQQRVAELWRVSDAFKKSELNITKLEEAENIVGLASEWLELDSPDEWVRQDSELALRQELAYASYLNVATVILPPPRNRQHVTDYARAINGCFASTPSVLSSYVYLSVRIPLSGIRKANRSGSVTPGSSGSTAAAPTETDVNEIWEMWDTIRTICGYNQRLSVSLDLSYPLPPSKPLLDRWNSEPLRYIFLSASAFVANNRGYPVLPKATQAFIRDVIKHHPGIILSGVDKGIHRTGGHTAYQQYIRYLEKTSPYVVASETLGTVENFATGYWDFLQAPLQVSKANIKIQIPLIKPSHKPLMDNLQSSTYEVFERDPVKYSKYEEAIYQALCDRAEDSHTIICIAGAGRGGLVSRCLSAIARSHRSANVYAVEKNPSAYVTLQEKRDTEWEGAVQLVFGDMRVITPPEKADILVSELLGSFGDNELSPECLDGANRFLKDDGISIPSSYTAYLEPVSSSRLFRDASNSLGDVKGAETPYVVMFQAVNELSTEPQECWEFQHPRHNAITDQNGLPLTNSHNTRSAHLSFHIPQAGIVHGLAGYFEAVLYGDVGLSIHPDRKNDVSPNMLSWFPLFFPLREPVYVPANAELDVHLWRLTDKRKVWYEWFVEAFYPTSVSPTDPPQSPSGVSNISEINAPPPPSPMVDALALSPERRFGDLREGDAALEMRVKIGQSSLHNPGGRSSWIGL